MAKKSSPKKTKAAEKPKATKAQEGTITGAQSLLPEKGLFRIDEAAVFFSVTERTIRLWIEHGILRAVKKGGVIRVLRESILECHIVDRQNSA